jgi:hypothetical protein
MPIRRTFGTARQACGVHFAKPADLRPVAQWYFLP